MGDGGGYPGAGSWKPEWQFCGQKWKKAASQLAEDILFYIAENIQNNVRELEGALKPPCCLPANGKQRHCFLTRQKIFCQYYRPKKRITSAKKIARIVAEFYNITTGRLD